MSRIGIMRDKIVKQAGGIKVELDVVIVAHVDGTFHTFCDAGKYWQDDPATRNYSRDFRTSHRDRKKAMQTAWKRAESFAKELILQKHHYKVAKSLKGG